ncbi:TetR/AcrR family transcriptional regulator [Sphingosinithalassobacter portus]|uniref:TetR/AcrR family transcriptional regulator n=1 Tax=Stakelama portus TaxID=2676234 RepID=UPI000D6E85C7|nr:TetR/AcrR family transcriptional regulator [Sphingosinithalassobacter portus]
MMSEENSPAACAPPRQRRSQAERREETRRRAIDAAIACLAEEGYAATTTITVAKRANISRGGMLHHFPTKTDLIVSVMQEIEQRVHMMRRDEILRYPKGVERFLALTDVTWATMAAPEMMASLEILMAQRGDEALEERLIDVADDLDHFQLEGTQRIARAAGIENDDLVEAMHTLHQAAFRGLMIERLITRKPEKIDAALDLLRWYKRVFADRMLNEASEQKA